MTDIQAWEQELGTAGDPSRARAYVYQGEWVADCTRQPDCGNVEFLMEPVMKGGPRINPKPVFLCSNCTMMAAIDWPHDMLGIMEVLGRRPVPQTRNWYPRDHVTAVRHRIPHGQSVADLQAENREHGVE